MSEAHEVEEADHAKCVHPGWPLLTGWDAVRSSWEAIFESTEEMRFTLGDIRVEMAGEFAWVVSLTWPRRRPTITARWRTSASP